MSHIKIGQNISIYGIVVAATLNFLSAKNFKPLSFLFQPTIPIESNQTESRSHAHAPLICNK